jgi:hypothetical protein
MQMVRRGPFVPVRIWWCDHEPGDPENKLDRGGKPFLAAEVGGEWYDPPKSIWTEPVFEFARERQTCLAGHWKQPMPLSEQRYRLEAEAIRQARELGRRDPRLTPYRPVRAQDVPLPVFHV